jgi:hypothetical protein
VVAAAGRRLVSRRPRVVQSTFDDDGDTMIEFPPFQLPFTEKFFGGRERYRQREVAGQKRNARLLVVVVASLCSASDSCELPSRNSAMVDINSTVTATMGTKVGAM